MPKYDFCGSIRIEANSEDEATDIFTKITEGYERHINEIEEVK